jgi:D-glycero-alpha-D-manno-heptose-7-phosphate kinase
MIVKATAPSRLSLFGGGTDTEPYASQYGGLVLSLAINLRQEIEVETPGTGTYYLPKNGNSDFIQKILDKFKVGKSSVSMKSDVKLNSGMGASATAAVAVIGAINRLKGLNLTKEQIAEAAWEVEVKDIGMFGGKQDQYAAALGGINVMEFGKEVKVTKLTHEFIDKILPSIVLLHTGITRDNPKIQEQMKDLTEERVTALNLIKHRVTQGIEIIIEGDSEKLGAFLDDAWKLKKQSNPLVTTPRIDNIYTNAQHYGAWGGKLCGSGGGGYMFFIVDPTKRELFIEKITKEGLEWVDFEIDWNGVETRIL